jgi:nucleoside-diphosphate-sugar epimerase
MRRVGSLERFLYVGTAFICGERGTRVIREDDYPRPGVKHLVEYTASKAECELLLEATAPELPLVVARPSVVVGHTELGCLPSASLFWFYRAINALRRLPISPESMEDVIPVDYAAEALLFLLFKPQLRYRRYHVSAGEQSSVHWNEIAAAFSACEGRASDEPFQCADFATVERERGRLAALFGPGDEDHLLMALRLYYRFMETGVQVFDNQRLLDEGMSAPPAFTSYLKQCATLPDGRSIYKQMLDDE